MLTVFLLIVSVLFFNLYPTLYFRYLPILHISQFIVGNVAGIVFINKGNMNSSNSKLILISILLFALIVFPFKTIEYENGLLAIFFAFFIYSLSSNVSIISTLFRNKFMIYLGEISFGIYILQAPVWLWSRIILKNVYNLTGIRALSYSTVFWINIFFLIFLASFCYKYIEIPFKYKINSFKFSAKLPSFQKIDK